ncbi:MAG: class I SAM-dependent methyltransferase [Nitrososphaerota archaeon]|nr:class I SAM-dependent methyltransferase [Candidatus Calditenuaceae archaeon]MDW8073662.1 class I SAM-dependent methyltransferase [Nitrososphaerota archaeon]
MNIFRAVTQSLAAAMLENPLRRLIQDPYRVLGEIGVVDGVNLLDIGCGTGYISVPAAELVGPAGHVYAVDIDEAKLSTLRRKAEKKSLRNLTVIKAEAWSINQIQPATIDLALMFFSLHHFAKPRESLIEAANKLRRGGRLFIYDPIKSRLAGHGTNIGDVVKICTEIGLLAKSLRKNVVSYILEVVKP